MKIKVQGKVWFRRVQLRMYLARCGKTGEVSFTSNRTIYENGT